MKASLITGINVLGIGFLVYYFYSDLRSLFSEELSIIISLIISATFAAIALQLKELSALGGTGSVLFFLFSQEYIFSILHYEIALIYKIAITFILVVLIGIFIDRLVNIEPMSIADVFFDILIAILAVLLGIWLIPMLSDYLGILIIKTLAMPITLLVYFILVIHYHHEMSQKKERIQTNTKSKKPVKSVKISDDTNTI